MQKEIKKRASVYGVTAVLLAVILSALCYNLGVIPGFGPPIGPSPTPNPHPEFLSTFSSYDELRNYLLKNSGTQGVFPYYGPSDVRILGPDVVSPAESTPGLKLYSTTNVQVAGVDEADIVKTDGEYIYLVSGSSVYILKAYPPEEAEVLSNITFGDDLYPIGVFVDSTSHRLAVLGSKYEPWTFPSWSYSGYYCVDIKTFANIYDISDKENPASLMNFTITGSYFSSRMIGDYIYFVASQPTYIIYDTVVLPKIYLNNAMKEIGPSEIHYANVSDNYYQYTTIVALNTQNITEVPTEYTIMLGGTSSMYVSLSNIYITFPESYEQTSIYRIRIENSTIYSAAHGMVNGHELNQFSMDEYSDYFRIATTTWMNKNNLYVLDMNLSQVGNLTDFAPPGETMDSARFIGNRCYLSTSTPRKDPFFVIDVENASEPKILGNLSIPGFTRYLHPYDDDHVIGIGIDGGNVKITLFDVSDVSAPINMSEYKFSGVWSDTSALTEHKAFLFDKLKELLVIPVSIKFDSYSVSSWQGACVFNITLENGLVLKGNVTHLESGMNGYEYAYWVNRALYINDTLYTLSDKKIMMNSLEDLLLINEISFP